MFFSAYFRKYCHAKFQENSPIRAEMFHADGRTGKHDDADSRYCTIFRTHPKHNCTYCYLAVNQCTIFLVPFLFSFRLTPATDSQRRPITAFSTAVPPALCCTQQQQHISAIGPHYLVPSEHTAGSGQFLAATVVLTKGQALQYCSCACEVEHLDSQLL